MRSNSLNLIASIILFATAIGFASPNDTICARLKTGARIRGTILSSNSSSITIRVVGIGDTKFDWSDITYLSSKAVYDSLAGEKSFIVLPPPESPSSSLGTMWSSEIFFGYAIQNDKGFGFGEQGMFIIGHVSAGLIGMGHFGTDAKGLTSVIYWGPQIGGTITWGNIAIEPVLSYGQARFTKFTSFILSDATASCFSPGLIIRVNLGFSKIGLQYRYFDAEALKFSALYFSVGQ